MDNNNDILFSSLGAEEVKPDEALEHSFEGYAHVFNQIASRLERLFNEENPVVEDLEPNMLKYLSSGNSRSEDDWGVTDLYGRYKEFLDAYQQFLSINQSLWESLDKRGLSISDLEYWPDIDWDFWWYDNRDSYRAAYLLQFVGSSYLIVDRLWDVYQFVTKKNSDVYELAYEGCCLINYKWTDYFKTLTYIRANTKLFKEAIASFIVGMPMIGKSIHKRFTEIERKGAAFAEYPYQYQRDGSILINPVSVTVSRVKKELDRKHRRLNLDDRFGLSVALFDCKMGRDNLRCLSFAGTRLGYRTARALKVMIQNVITDIFQYFNAPSRTYFEAVALVNDVVKSFPKRKIHVFGHSLGGGLMQYACAAINSDKLHGYGYNPAGLSDYTLQTIPGYDQLTLKSSVSLISSLHDPVSRLGNQLADIKYVYSVKGLSAHCLDQLNMQLNGGVEMKVGY